MEYRLKIGDEILMVQCAAPGGGTLEATIAGKKVRICARRISSHELQLTVDGRAVTVFMNGGDDAKELLVEGRRCIIADADLLEQRSAGGRSVASAPTDVSPPMPAVVMQVLVAEGDCVEPSQPLIVVSAMKMETTLSAPYAGIVTRIHAKEGDRVAARQILMDIKKTDAGANTG